MRFVHVIARLREDVARCNTVLVDLCAMIDPIFNEACLGAWKGGEKAMYQMLCELEDNVQGERARLTSRIAGYEYRRDFRTS